MQSAVTAYYVSHQLLLSAFVPSINGNDKMIGNLNLASDDSHFQSFTFRNTIITLICLACISTLLGRQGDLDGDTMCQRS